MIIKLRVYQCASKYLFIYLLKFDLLFQFYKKLFELEALKKGIR